MNIVHLLASPFVGGPERQVLGLARALPGEYRTTFLSFAERGLARPFLERARADGFEAIELKENFPRLSRSIREVADHLRHLRADVLCCSGYKPDLIGWRSARRVGIPVVSIAHGWTGVTFKVRLYETADAFALRFMDAAVCVSEAMAQRVRAAGVPASKVAVIRNALDSSPYDHPDPHCRQRLMDFFRTPPALIVGAAGRLSPEKGFDVFVEAASLASWQRSNVGFLLFGDGPMRPALEERIAKLGLADRFVLAGFRTDLHRLLPGLDLAVLSSHTEGLPVAVLEAQAAGVAVVATAVGGTPEVIVDGQTGWLVPPADPAALADRIILALADDAHRRALGQAGRQCVRQEWTFAAQAERYQRLFERLAPHPPARPPHPPAPSPKEGEGEKAAPHPQPLSPEGRGEQERKEKFCHAPS
jgi:glycosyltransferase involved in cell wall biosynthesis